ncbi:MAG: hypothetical protein HC890_03845 [Chloroflexaceae bacterium]|nr:hypothetical protein [Chloroflexaceae bacterium]
MMGLLIPILWLAQIGIESEVEVADEAAYIFDGPQFFAALIAGVLLAFAFQLLFTNLGVAAGISLMGRSHRDDVVYTPEVVPTTTEEAENLRRQRGEDHQTGFGSTIKKIGTTLGLATLITVTLSLFLACLLAVKLSLLVSAGLGAIVGLVIWATYFCLLMWASSNAVNSIVGSVVGSVINTATAGMQAILGTATAALGGRAVNREVVATAEAAAAAVRRELGNALDPQSLREQLEDYIEAIKPPRLDRNAIRADLERLLDETNLQGVSDEAYRG